MTVLAAGASTQAPLRHTCPAPASEALQSESAEQRLPTHLPSSHSQPSAEAQNESAYLPRTAAVQSEATRQAGSQTLVVVLQKNSCGSPALTGWPGQSVSSKQVPLMPPPPPLPLSILLVTGLQPTAKVSVAIAIRRMRV